MTNTNSNRFNNDQVCELREANHSPIYGYQHLPILTLEKSIEKLLPIVPGLGNYVIQAKENCRKTSTNLTLDESASIYLYTMQISFFSKLNKDLRAKNRNALKPWFSYLKLLITALEKLPSLEITIWRGVNDDVSSSFINNDEEIWWGINSCSKDPNIVGIYVGPKGTIFAINAIQGKDISEYSAVKDEEEVVLMPGTRLFVRYKPMNFENCLLIIHLHEEPKLRLTTVENHRKIALVIGNNKYQTKYLTYCVNDAIDLSITLENMGFLVITKFNVNYEIMDKEIRNFTESIQSNDIVLFFFSGHGLQSENENYLVPCDEDLEYQTISLQYILEQMTLKDPLTIIYLLDCSREYFLQNRSLLQGMTNMKALSNSIIISACAPNTIAKDQSINDRNGVFTYYLVQNIIKPAENILLMLTNVTNGVANETNNRQIPYVTSDLKRKDIYLVSSEWKNSINSSLNHIPLIKSGKQFGGTGGHTFDDYIENNLTYSHYLRGMITGCKALPLDWCQFCYSSSNDNCQMIIQTDMQGTCETDDDIERFIINQNERINKIQVVIDYVILLVGDIRKLVPLIRGIRFFTTNGQSSQSIDHLEGDSYTEEFYGYFVGYITGRSGLLIDQLQFHWFRNNS
ncbi:unnamed protein product [Adineta steineri]|uniref:Caspase family p20 domain-containing protein n=1 Tax=Adineta steineri TaxID=433720 RepID=A0A813MT86_9BILA|nr:unnamed protein product [Adineta steineri]CAF0848937.1 unnamed protein product [Adineta steineri]